MKITGTQIRMARAALNWSARELAAASEIAENAITRIERGEVMPRLSTQRLLRVTLEAHGVTFHDDGSVQPPSSAS